MEAAAVAAQRMHSPAVIAVGGMAEEESAIAALSRHVVVQGDGEEATGPGLYWSTVLVAY